MGIKSVLIASIVSTITAEKCVRPTGTQLIGAYGDFGEWAVSIKTLSADAQALWTQGMLLIFGFNQEEARENFKAAIAIDSDCIMCYWGLALASSPNVNTLLTSETHALGLHALAQAQTRCFSVQKETEEYECKLVNALSNRFPTKEFILTNWKPDPTDPKSYSVHLMQKNADAYANAMSELYKEYPNDTTIASLYAESQMSRSPWNYYDGKDILKPLGQKAWKALEFVLAKEHHPLALHLWIHLTEPSDKYKHLAIEAAFWIRTIAPAADHLIHMASHTYHRTGRHSDAITTNYEALAVHAHYFKHCLVPYGTTHDPATIIGPAMALGLSNIALKYSSKFNDPETVRLSRQNSGSFATPDVLVQARFGMWRSILNMDNKHENIKNEFMSVFWLYTQALAHSGIGQHHEAKQLSEKLLSLCDQTVPSAGVLYEEGTAFYPHHETKCIMAYNTVAARLALVAGKNEAAIEYMIEAVALEDGTMFNEPRLWYLPLRQCLAATYLHSGNALEALNVYEADLITNPQNIWSLKGRYDAIRTLGFASSLENKARFDFEIALASADVSVPITTSCMELFVKE